MQSQSNSSLIFGLTGALCRFKLRTLIFIILKVLRPLFEARKWKCRKNMKEKQTKKRNHYESVLSVMVRLFIQFIQSKQQCTFY